MNFDNRSAFGKVARNTRTASFRVTVGNSAVHEDEGARMCAAAAMRAVAAISVATRCRLDALCRGAPSAGAARRVPQSTDTSA